MILADLKWNKHECLMYPTLCFPSPLHRSWEIGLLRIYNCLFYSWPSLWKNKATPCVVAEVLLYANMWDTYHRNGYLVNESSWIFVAALPNLSNVASKFYSDMLGKWGPAEPSKEQIEATKRQKINGAEKHGLMISLQRNSLLALCFLISVWIRMILLIFARMAWQCGL